MSVATDLYTVVPVPEQARAPRGPERLASVTTLHGPVDSGAASPVRLTRRGVVVLSLVVAVLAVALVGLARSSAPVDPAPAAVIGNAVTVQSGDTLWTIASRVAPARDPRAEIAQLQQLNHLTDSALVPGQVLRVR